MRMQRGTHRTLKTCWTDRLATKRERKIRLLGQFVAKWPKRGGGWTWSILARGGRSLRRLVDRCCQLRAHWKQKGSENVPDRSTEPVARSSSCINAFAEGFTSSFFPFSPISSIASSSFSSSSSFFSSRSPPNSSINPAKAPSLFATRLA